MITRRLVSVPAAVVALPLVAVTAPVWILVAVTADLAQRHRRLPTLRLGAMAVVYLVHQWVCLAAALGLVVADLWRRIGHGGGGGLERWRAVEGWWASSLVRWGGRLLGIHFDLPDPGQLPDGGFILLSRHASMGDALLPVYLVAGRQRRFVHYVLKRELRFDPTLDIYGRHLGNHFISRTGDGDSEVAALSALARAALPDSALVIFPEGTYATPGRRLRIRRSLERRGEDNLVALTDELHHLLPPKPGGTLALFDGQPGYDVVIMGHVGLEGVSNLSGLRRHLPLDRPVTVRWWRHARAELPEGDEARIAWLNEQWRTLDRWVDSELSPEQDP